MTTTEQMVQWARVGAKERLQALMAERAEILRLFPDLGSELGLSLRARRGRPRGASTMTAEQRQRMSDAAKERWRKRRESQPNGQAGEPMMAPITMGDLVAAVG